MDYLKIVLQGFFNKNNRRYLDKYFIREFRKAEKDHYELDEFFDGCLDVIKEFEKDIENQLQARKRELLWIINDLKHPKGEETDAEKKAGERLIKELETEANTLDRNNFPVNLRPLTNFLILYDLSFDEVAYIKDTINGALNKTRQPVTSPPKLVEKRERTETDNYSHKQVAIAYEIMKLPINTENALSILQKHTKHRSVAVLLRNRISKASTLSSLAENKTTDTKHKKDLIAAKRLISGMKKQSKNKNAIADIDRIITAFQTSYENKY